MAEPDDESVKADSSGVESSEQSDSESHVAAATSETSEPDPVSKYTTDRRTLSSSVQLIWLARLLMSLGVLTALGLFVAGQFGFDPIFVAGGIGTLAILGVVWVHLRYRIWSFRVREDALYLERGVIRHVRTVAPHVRIQHVDTARGPLERSLGLSTLVVYTAGSRGADVSIPGLTTEEATDLQARLKELAIAVDGGDAL